jgi:hypothetical protein
MKNPTANSGGFFNGKSFMGVAPSNLCTPFIIAASGAVFWLFPHILMISYANNLL